jgi:hypothetical protein
VLEDGGTLRMLEEVDQRHPSWALAAARAIYPIAGML